MPADLRIKMIILKVCDRVRWELMKAMLNVTGIVCVELLSYQSHGVLRFGEDRWMWRCRWGVVLYRTSASEDSPWSSLVERRGPSRGEFGNGWNRKSLLLLLRQGGVKCNGMRDYRNLGAHNSSRRVDDIQCKCSVYPRVSVPEVITA